MGGQRLDHLDGTITIILLPPFKPVIKKFIKSQDVIITKCGVMLKI